MIMGDEDQSPAATKGGETHVDVELLQKMFGPIPPSEKGPQIVVSIPKVPERLARVAGNDAYEPRIISIGPYHRGKSNLQQMEKHKLSHLEVLLQRNPNVGLEDYIKELRSMEEKARRCYSEQYLKLNVEKFVNMLLLDGGFIVEFLLRLYEGKVDEKLQSVIWMVPQIQFDLLLLENQLPFFVLESIYKLATGEDGDELKKLAIKVGSIFSVWKTSSHTEEDKSLRCLLSGPVHHLLHLYYRFLVPDNRVECYSCWSTKGLAIYDPIKYGAGDRRAEGGEHGLVSMIRSATVLQEAGIKFKKKEGRIWDVEFSDGVMKIPPLLIDSFTMYQFRNLITFEQLCPNMKPVISTYMLFLDYLVNSSKDVSLLRGEDIIEHMLGSDEDVALLFNSLTKGTFRPSRHYLCDMYRDVECYCKTKRHRWRAALVHNYFHSPWAVLSLVAAIILLGLTLIQTFFSVYSYFRPPF